MKLLTRMLVSATSMYGVVCLLAKLLDDGKDAIDELIAHVPPVEP